MVAEEEEAIALASIGVEEEETLVLASDWLDGVVVGKVGGTWADRWYFIGLKALSSRCRWQQNSTRERKSKETGQKQKKSKKLFSYEFFID